MNRQPNNDGTSEISNSGCGNSKQHTARLGTGELSRRNMLKLAGGGMLALSTAAALASEPGAKEESREFYRVKNGRINQSVIYWCFKPMPVPELAANAAK